MIRILESWTREKILNQCYWKPIDENIMFWIFDYYIYNCDESKAGQQFIYTVFLLFAIATKKIRVKIQFTVLLTSRLLPFSTKKTIRIIYAMLRSSKGMTDQMILSFWKQVLRSRMKTEIFVHKVQVRIIRLLKTACFERKLRKYCL